MKTFTELDDDDSDYLSDMKKERKRIIREHRSWFLKLLVLLNGGNFVCHLLARRFPEKDVPNIPLFWAILCSAVIFLLTLLILHMLYRNRGAFSRGREYSSSSPQSPDPPDLPRAA